jgi:hypothetical protein
MCRSIYHSAEEYSILKTGEFDALLTTSLMKFPTTAYYTHSTVIAENS